MHNFLQMTSHLPLYFEMRQSRLTLATNASTAARRKVSYPDRNAELGSGRHDYQNSTLSDLRGSAFVIIHNL
jgi:hypothetical protein